MSSEVNQHHAGHPPPPVKPATTMTIVCAWCGKFLGEKDGQGQTGITHGICIGCKAKELAKIPAPRTH